MGGAVFNTTPIRHALEDVSQGAPPDMALLLLDAMVADPGSAGLVEEAVRWQQPGGVTALHTAASWGHQQLAAKLVEAGADRDAVTQLGATPLWCAAAAGHSALVPLLATLANINLTASAPPTAVPTPLYVAVQNGHGQVVEALLAAGAATHISDSSNRGALIAAVERGDAQIITRLVAVLSKQCGQQQQQQQQQQDREQQQEKEGHDRLVHVLAMAYIAEEMQLRRSATHCCQLLEVVLDVLGPEVAGEVCQAVQQLLQEEWEEAQPQPRAGLSWVRAFKRHGTQVSRLAEALLLGGLGAVERLHAARQPLVGRLQRLVVQPVAGKAGNQQQTKRYQLYDWTPALVDWRLPELVTKAEQAAAAGEEQRALQLLKEVAALYLQHNDNVKARQCSKAGSTTADPCSTGAAGDVMHSHSHKLRLLVRTGLGTAVFKPLVVAGCSDQEVSPARDFWYSFRPPGVYTTFLAAWVEARRHLQQVPRQVVSTVVAAVTAAQQQQQQQSAEEQQGWWKQQQQQLGCKEEEETHCDLLPLLLLHAPCLADPAAAALTGG